jgi:hypothetical protein
MSFYNTVAKDVFGSQVGKPSPSGQPTVPPEVGQQIDQPGPTFDPFGRLADVYQQSFGSATEGGALVAVPVNPQQSGGGVNLKPVLLLGGLAVGGYFLYKKFAS